MLPNFRLVKSFAWACAVALLLVSASVPASAKTKHKTHKASKSASAKSGKSGKKSHKGKASAKKPRGQQAIDNSRARQIQEALIREHYMNGEPSGEMDQSTRAALVKFQGDNGWQTKVVPDSRALIKLGLGPDHSKVLNPEAINRPDTARDQVPGGASQLQQQVPQ